LPFIKNSEIWGGNHAADTNISTDALTASLFSTASTGGKGGDIYYFSVCSPGILTRIVLADVVGHRKVISDTSRWLYDSLALRINDMEGKYVLRDLNMQLKKHHFDAFSTAAVITFHKEK
jgi:phosphoserine phosphatase RsbU/P